MTSHLILHAGNRNYGRLLQLYAVHKTAREARKRGLSVQRMLRTDGSIKLTLGGL